MPDELDQRERLAAELRALGLARMPRDHQPVADIVEHVHMREERVVLEHGVDRPAIGRHARHGSPKISMSAGGRLLEAGDQSQARGLARAGGAEHGEELARRDVEIDAVDRADGAEVALDAAEGDGGMAPQLAVEHGGADARR